MEYHKTAETTELNSPFPIHYNSLIPKMSLFTLSCHLLFTMSKDLAEAEETKKKWQEYTKEQYKKGFNDLINHDGVITHLESDILECEVKWALGSITMKKVS